MYISRVSTGKAFNIVSKVPLFPHRSRWYEEVIHFCRKFPDRKLRQKYFYHWQSISIYSRDESGTPQVTSYNTIYYGIKIDILCFYLFIFWRYFYYYYNQWYTVDYFTRLNYLLFVTYRCNVLLYNINL